MKNSTDRKFSVYIDGNELEGLLVDFINEKMTSYQEPSRLGTPKGEPIGFMLPKYRAALLGLTTCTMKDIAVQTGVSFDLIRKWRGENDFKAKVKHLEEEFARKLVRIMDKRPLTEEEARDAGIYSLNLKHRIISKIDYSSTAKSLEFKDIANIFRLFLNDLPEKERKPKELMFLKILDCMILNYAESILRKEGEITAEEREVLLRVVSSFKGSLNVLRK